jgi:hypothetical protein
MSFLCFYNYDYYGALGIWDHSFRFAGYGLGYLYMAYAFIRYILLVIVNKYLSAENSFVRLPHYGSMPLINDHVKQLLVNP